MKKGRLYTLLGFVVLVVGAAIYTVDFLYAKEQTTLASYETKSPEMGDIILKTVASGSIQPRQEILIKPQVSGIVRVVHVEAGDLVKAVRKGWFRTVFPISSQVSRLNID